MRQGTCIMGISRSISRIRSTMRRTFSPVAHNLTIRSQTNHQKGPETPCFRPFFCWHGDCAIECVRNSRHSSTNKEKNMPEIEKVSKGSPIGINSPAQKRKQVYLVTIQYGITPVMEGMKKAIAEQFAKGTETP